MSTLALMRWLETAPQRYDAGMRALTFGRVRSIHDLLAETAAPELDRTVLEIGCGTGAVVERLVARGARVTALDQNPEMLEIARRRLADSRDGAVTWLERTASEIGALPEGRFDAVVASFSMSEMSTSERAFVLRKAFERLRPGGVLAVADEVRPARGWERALFALMRIPQAALGWLLVGATSHPIPDLAEEVRAAGFRIRAERWWLLGSLTAVIGERMS